MRQSPVPARLLTSDDRYHAAIAARPLPAPLLPQQAEVGKRVPLAEGAAARLRFAILEGTLPMGTRVSEARLAAELGVSRGTVREAVQRLNREGLVQRSSTGRIHVTGISAQEVADLFGLRLALEGLAVRAAVPRLTSADVRYLNALIDPMDELEDESVPYQALAQLDLAFHEYFITLARQRLLAQAWDGIRGLVLALMEVTDLHNPRLPKEVWQRHRAILIAAARGETEAAIAALAENLGQGQEITVTRLEAVRAQAGTSPDSLRSSTSTQSW